MGVDRRTKGSGGVYQRGDGRWVAAVSLPTEDGKRRRRVFYGKTRDEAEAKMQAAFPDLTENAPGVWATRRAATMADARLLGRHTPKEWGALLKKCGHTCHYCGERRAGPRGRLTKDHRVPITRGGSDAIDNIVPACKSCNSKKGDMTEDEWWLVFAGRPVQP